VPGPRTNKPRKRGSFHHGDLRRALLDAAGEILDRRGPLEVGLRAVARAAGVSQTAPYRHFTDKEALLAAVAAQGLAGLGERAAAAVAAAHGPEEALRAVGRAYVQVAVARPHLFRLMFGPEVSDKARYPEVREAGERAFAVVVAAIAAGQRAGTIRDGEPGELALVVWSAVHGFASLIVDGRLTEWTERLGGPAALGDRLAELLRRGIAPR
jgi:AcrR family transcriptional regulator